MAVRTNAELQTQVDTLLADNTTRAITEGDVRSVFTDVNDSFLLSAEDRYKGAASSSAQVTLTSSAAAVTGCTVTITGRSGASYLITGIAEVARTGGDVRARLDIQVDAATVIFNNISGASLGNSPNITYSNGTVSYIHTPGAVSVTYSLTAHYTTGGGGLIRDGLATIIVEELT